LNISRVKLRLLSLFGIIFLFIFSGCEQILDEALNKNLTVEEPLFQSETASESDQTTYEVTTGFVINASGTALAKPDYHGFAVVPTNMALFAWVCSEEDGFLRGTVTNNASDPVALNIRFGHTDDFASATLVASVSVSGTETRNFQVNGSAFESCFDDHFQGGYTELFIFIDAAGSGTIDMVLNKLEFVLQPSAYLSRTVGPVSGLEDYVDNIVDVSGVAFSGTINNLGSSEVYLLLRLIPLSSDSEWDGAQVEIVIEANDSFDLSDLSSLLSDEDMARIGDAIEYLSGASVLAELFCTGSGGVNVEVVSIVLEGSVNVTL